MGHQITPILVDSSLIAISSLVGMFSFARSPYLHYYSPTLSLASLGSVLVGFYL